MTCECPSGAHLLQANDTTTWKDKDFLLNVMGLHHFHLGLRKETSGLIARTNEVVLASVARDNLELMGLFDHSVFEWSRCGGMAPERNLSTTLRHRCS